ncbi:uncharacterized protein LOC110965835 [Acanthochromis polyacanthus]|uniref:Uncharacterized LOC110965835 n=1 Tax=Acanthochromis polyacanthus TaxID=80966 RepID=A0A3Q1G642_9TELE|nr:uncharacterized protein LOC110965835 [Acanthochromis polyacanthus]
MPMQERKNKRGHVEYFVSGRHLNLDDLKHEAQNVRNKYLPIENIPDYPQPEFHVAHLKHETDEEGLNGIKKDEGFKFPHSDSDNPHKFFLQWWSLAVSPEEVNSAETRFLQQKFSSLTEDQAAIHSSFFFKFTTSPAFSECSRLGSYRFTCPLEEVLDAYRQQFCSGDQPVMRLYETVLHPKEVQHTVLVHSPANQEDFSEYPLLTDDPNAICVYKDGRFIWRPYAICSEHRHKLICKSKTKEMDVQQLTWKDKVYYIWDNVAIALHVGEQVLRFDTDQLRKNLKFCDKNYPAIVPTGRFNNFEEAKIAVGRLWPDCDFPLEKESSLEQRFTVQNLRLVLVGRSGSRKSSSGNIILGRDAFSAGNAQCCLQTEKVFSWELTVVDTPGLSETPDTQTEILKCIDMSAPGPHAILLVIKVETLDNEGEDIVRQMEKIFGENVWRHTFVVLTFEDGAERDGNILNETKTKVGKILDWEVGERYYVLNNKQQVWDLLDELATMVFENREKFYSVQNRVSKRKITDVDGAITD